MFSAFMGFGLLPRAIFLCWPVEKKWIRYLIIPFIFGMILFSWIWPAAKNDAIPFLGILVGFYYWKLDRFFLFAFFAGIGLGIKLTNLYPYLFILLLLLYDYHQQKKKAWRPKQVLAFIITGNLLGLFPILWRNWAETGNPLFPTASFLFPNLHFSGMGYAYLASFSRISRWHEIWPKMFHLLKSSWALLPLLGMGLFRAPRLLTIYIIAIFFFMATFTGPDLAHRTYSMILLLPILWLLEFFKTLSGRMQILAAFLIIINSRAQVENLIKIPYKLEGQTIRQAMDNPRLEYPYFEEVIKFNHEHRQKFGLWRKETMGGGQDYFSRFLPINIRDSIMTTGVRIPWNNF